MDFNGKMFRLIITAIILVMAIEIVILTFQNRRLNSILNDRRIKINIGLREGDKISNINDFFEGKYSFKFSNDSIQKLLLIFFSKDCHACIMDIPNWKRIMDKSEKRIKVLGISLSNEKDTNEFIKKNAINFDVIIDDNFIIANNFQIRSIPTKILINVDNIIEFIQIGASPKSSNNNLLRIISNKEEKKRKNTQYYSYYYL